jgi:hypothetical protein
MTAARRRFSRLAVGMLDDLPDSVSRGSSARELLIEILLTPARRTIPGLLQMGEAALAERIRWRPAVVRKRLLELEAARLLVFDRDARALYVRGAIDCDGPTTRQATIAMARELRELRPSALREELAAAIVATLSDGEHDQLIEVWRAEYMGTDPKPDPDSHSDDEIAQKTYLARRIAEAFPNLKNELLPRAADRATAQNPKQFSNRAAEAESDSRPDSGLDSKAESTSLPSPSPSPSPRSSTSTRAPRIRAPLPAPEPVPEFDRQQAGSFDAMLDSLKDSNPELHARWLRRREARSGD